MTSRKNKGLGMGLLHCYVFALSAKGTVYHDSIRKESGAKFTLVLPFRLQEEE